MYFFKLFFYAIMVFKMLNKYLTIYKLRREENPETENVIMTILLVFHLNAIIETIYGYIGYCMTESS